MSSQLTIHASDAFPLAADLFEAEKPRVAAVIASATGVPRQMYRQFAEYLAEDGVSVLTFDYRGIGGSRPNGSLRGFAARAEDWGALDLDAALRDQQMRYRHLPLVAITHSIGGQILGLAPMAQEVDAALFIASQSGYWKYWDGFERWKILFYWYCLFPILLPTFGYLPMRRVTGGEDLPRGMAQEWMEWGRHPNYVLSNRLAQEKRGHARFAAPIRSYAFADDLAYAPRRAAEALLTYYESAASEFCFVYPRDIGETKIGHFGAFRPRFKETLWKEWRDWVLNAPTTR